MIFFALIKEHGISHMFSGCDAKEVISVLRVR
jgi:hypothetical protein